MDCVIGLGSNLGDRRQTLRLAVKTLRSTGAVTAVSCLYESEAVGPPQPPFLNAAVRLRSSTTPDELLGRLKHIEDSFGRQRLERWGARTLDLDVLWIAGLCVASPHLTVPHPHLAERAFALRPLLDVAPDATHPTTGVAYALIAERFATSAAESVAGPEWVELAPPLCV
jgi:2-amino-4-hydroxy-6-hydroxymethyldihydropteridine diphosphokinase